MLFLSSADFFSKSSFSKYSFTTKENYRDQQPGSKLFIKVISRPQKVAASKKKVDLNN